MCCFDYLVARDCVLWFRWLRFQLWKQLQRGKDRHHVNRNHHWNSGRADSSGHRHLHSCCLLLLYAKAKVSWSGVQTTSQSDDNHHGNTTILSKPVSSSATLYTVPHSSKSVPFPRVCSAPAPCTWRVFPSPASTTNDRIMVPPSGEQGSTLSPSPRWGLPTISRKPPTTPTLPRELKARPKERYLFWIEIYRYYKIVILLKLNPNFVTILVCCQFDLSFSCTMMFGRKYS